MMVKLVIVGAVVLVAVAAAFVAQRRRPAPPSNPTDYTAPAQLDRADFPGPDAPWLVAVFSSATCSTCAEVWTRAQVLESEVVAVAEVEAQRDAELHRRYRIEAVPITVVADSTGVVRRSFVGPVSSTHLWAALAELREPGSVPDGCDTGE